MRTLTTEEIKKISIEHKDSNGNIYNEFEYARDIEQLVLAEADQRIAELEAKVERITKAKMRLLAQVSQSPAPAIQPIAAEQVVQEPAFPERDLSKPAEQQGIFRKFEVRRVDGSDAPGGKHHGCRYFVLDLDHDQHAANAMAAYGLSCATTHPQLSAEILAKYPTQQPDSLAQVREDELWALIDTNDYLDPPDGGSVPLIEQLRRMAKQAKRYRYLRAEEMPQPRIDCYRTVKGNPTELIYGEKLDKAIDAAMQSTTKGEG